MFRAIREKVYLQEAADLIDAQQKRLLEGLDKSQFSSYAHASAAVGGEIIAIVLNQIIGNLVYALEQKNEAKANKMNRRAVAYLVSAAAVRMGTEEDWIEERGGDTEKYEQVTRMGFLKGAIGSVKLLDKVQESVLLRAMNNEQIVPFMMMPKLTSEAWVILYGIQNILKHSHENELTEKGRYIHRSIYHKKIAGDMDWVIGEKWREMFSHAA